jgi:hypothetical protein
VVTGEWILCPLPEGYGAFYRPLWGLLTMIQLLYNSGYVTWLVGPQIGYVSSPSIDKDARLSFGLLGGDMMGSWDGSWSRLWFAWLYLVAKHSHVEADVDGLACFLHYPMVYS